MSRPLRCLVLLLALGSGACSSSGSKGAPVERNLALHDYRNGQRFQLLDDATHSRVDQYSEVRQDANTKVVTAEVMGELVRFLRDNGFDEFAREGQLPTGRTEGIAWALELTEGRSTRHVLGYPPGLDAPAQLRLRNLRIAFLELYNSVYSLQAVEVKPGESPFKAPDYQRPSKR